ncbi:hypothetical protein [Rubritalea tangerina]|uniref:hypothetical protein n=1 Tax=Rubritalea tangerina TaxID=430798 RepID=UPI00360902A2
MPSSKLGKTSESSKTTLAPFIQPSVPPQTAFLSPKTNLDVAALSISLKAAPIHLSTSTMG